MVYPAQHRNHDPMQRLMEMDSMRFITFYLPQYHPIPENDAWWGKGFTDWVNVRKCTPRFPSHHQPHVPIDLGYYDLRDPSVRLRRQTWLAATESTPFAIITTGSMESFYLTSRLTRSFLPDNRTFRLLCWANENWTRIWDGNNDKCSLARGTL